MTWGGSSLDARRPAHRQLATKVRTPAPREPARRSLMCRRCLRLAAGSAQRPGGLSGPHAPSRLTRVLRRMWQPPLQFPFAVWILEVAQIARSTEQRREGLPFRASEIIFACRKDRLLRHWPTLLAFVAAMLLAFAGGPTLARTAACAPCPPDCPMMKGASPDAGRTSSPDPGGQKEKAPCERSVLCPAAVVVAPAPMEPVEVPQSAMLLAVRWTDSPPTPSRPPDRSLRPPIRA